MTISYRTIKLISSQINNLLTDYIGDINEAYAKTDKLNISIQVTLSPDSKGIKIRTSINFVQTRISDDITTVFDETQIDFSFEDTTKRSEDPPIPPDTTDEDLIKKIKIE